LAKATGICFFDYILVEDRKLPPEEQTVWKLRSLSYDEHEDLAELRGTASATGQMVFIQNPLRRARRALNLGLLGWENFRGPDGPAELKTKGMGSSRIILDETMNLIRREDAIEIADAIIEGAQLRESTSKNS